jgi:hypothetical protein
MLHLLSTMTGYHRSTYCRPRLRLQFGLTVAFTLQPNPPEFSQGATTVFYVYGPRRRTCWHTRLPRPTEAIRSPLKRPSFSHRLKSYLPEMIEQSVSGTTPRNPQTRQDSPRSASPLLLTYTATDLAWMAFPSMPPPLEYSRPQPTTSSEFGPLRSQRGHRHRQACSRLPRQAPLNVGN